ncbi:MAG: hypothetical protein IPJ85_09860 [Flavobacteriales bacterium]|nr:hypothetical protein [Flavobacteriales bacterium]
MRNVTGGYGNLRFTGTGTKLLYGTTIAKGNWVIDNVSGTPVVNVSASNFQVTVQGNWTNYNQSGFVEGSVWCSSTAQPEHKRSPLLVASSFMAGRSRNRWHNRW